MTIELGEIIFMMTLTEAKDNPAEETVTISAIPTEDTIHPRQTTPGCRDTQQMRS